MKELSKESVGKCVICKKEHIRENVEDWVYHVSRGVVCRSHPGVTEWYNDLLNRADVELVKFVNE